MEREVTSAGQRIECDFVVAGVGVEPAVELAAGTESSSTTASSSTNIAERTSRASTPPATWPTITTLCSSNDPRRALAQRDEAGTCRGAQHVGQVASTRDPLVLVRPVRLEPPIRGFHRTWEQLVLRGSLEERSLFAFYCTERRVLAAVALRPRQGSAIDPTDQGPATRGAGRARRSRSRPARAHNGARCD